MPKNYDSYKQWIEADEKKVFIDDLVYQIKVTTWLASYPVRSQRISVSAVPINKYSKHYLEVKADLGDDWVTDVLDSGDDFYLDIAKQVNL